MSSIAATQADGYYFPPDYDGRKHGSLSKHNTGSKEINQYDTYNVVRFEMPFDGWCLACNIRLSKGTRFNAKKDCVGNYHSTKIWSFTIKCFKCKNVMRIKTDPQNCTYDYYDGIRKECSSGDYDDDNTIIDTVTSSSDANNSSNPFYKLQHQLENANKSLTEKQRFEALIDSNDIRSKSDYGINSYIRSQHRHIKKKEKETLQIDQRKFNLPFTLVAHTSSTAATNSSNDDSIAGVVEDTIDGSGIHNDILLQAKSERIARCNQMNKLLTIVTESIFPSNAATASVTKKRRHQSQATDKKAVSLRTTAMYKQANQMIDITNMRINDNTGRSNQYLAVSTSITYTKKNYTTHTGVIAASEAAVDSTNNSIKELLCAYNDDDEDDDK